jgi:hypothetical protein
MISTLACLIQYSKVDHQSKSEFAKRLPLLKTEQAMNFRSLIIIFRQGAHRSEPACKAGIP